MVDSNVKVESSKVKVGLSIGEELRLEVELGATPDSKLEVEVDPKLKVKVDSKLSTLEADVTPVDKVFSKSEVVVEEPAGGSTQRGPGLVEAIVEALHMASIKSSRPCKLAQTEPIPTDKSIKSSSTPE
jgi:hypothetical protein